MQLFPVCNTDVQPQVVELCNRVLPQLEHDDARRSTVLSDLDAFLLAEPQSPGGMDLSLTAAHAGRTIAASAAIVTSDQAIPGGVLASFLLSLLASAMQVRVRRRTAGKMRTEPLNATTYVLAGAPPVPRTVANKLLFMLKNLLLKVGGGFEQLFVEVYKQAAVKGTSAFVQAFSDGDSFATEGADVADGAAGGVSALLVSVAALCVFGADSRRLLESWLDNSSPCSGGGGASPVKRGPAGEAAADAGLRAAGSDDPIEAGGSAKHAGFCDYHGDNYTRATVECPDCDLHLCHECDTVRHLHPKRAGHKRRPIRTAVVVGSGDSGGGAKAVGSVDGVAAEQLADSRYKPTELKFNDGCVTCITRGLRITVDIAKLHVHIDMKRDTGNASSLAAQSAFCRFCGVDLPPLDDDSAAASRPNVCDDEECQEKMAHACRKRLPCGHQCVGCLDEAICMPCVYGCQPDYGIDAYDKCRICSAEDLCEGPCVQLECGHVFHYLCIEEKLKYRWELQGPRISFAFMDCPLCRKPMRSPVISGLMEPLLKLKQAVENMVLLRLE